MAVALVTLTVLLALVLGAAGGAKVAAIPDMRRRASHLGFSVASYRVIGALELAGVVGLLAGLAAPALAVAAAVGLVLMMCGAVASHLHRGDILSEAVPATVVGLATAALLVLTVALA